MSPATLDRLTDLAANAAMRGASDYIRAHGLKVSDYEAAVAVIRRHVNARMTAALDDARAAFEARMPAAAEATFLAEMRLAGIAGAKEVAEKIV